MKWNVTKSVINGVGHTGGTQDSISQEPADDYVCVVMADGAGMARCAKEGSTFTTKTALDILRFHKDGIYDFTMDEIRNVVLSNLLDRLRKKAEEEGNILDDYMCTLMFFITNGDRYVIGNLGDGLIGCMNKDGEGRVLSMPEHGKFANQSFFVTQPEAFEHLRIGMGRFDSDCVYFLMTDGSADCLYNFKSGTFAKALTVFCGWTREHNPYDVNNFLRKSMYKLFPQKTNDDCSLAMIYLNER
ncbi:MAG: protein phosphatase 2C domain-containing protein [Bacteroidaceae bacterium]|nr:protein phosphatase 2C domain-containing protein [Bacteroidaceae bacterium]